MWRYIVFALSVGLLVWSHTCIPLVNWSTIWPTVFKLHKMIALNELQVPIVFGIKRAKFKVKVVIYVKKDSSQ